MEQNASISDLVLQDYYRSTRRDLMQNALRQVVYLSRAAPSAGEETVLDISRISRENNLKCDVTGLLIYDDQRFIQAIEGPDDAVSETFGRIVLDQRHAAVQVAANKVIDQRQFGTWSMECRRTPAGACSLVFLEDIKAAMAAVNDPALQAMFIGFAIMGDK